jgi:Uri superfamily endonuclease
MKGSYILLAELPKEQKISIGKLGIITFPKGFYAYVGSAMKGFESRIGRHLRKDKKPHWHIDFLLKKARIREIILCETEEKVECILAQALAEEFRAIPGFGSSDCKCESHLYFEKREDKLKARVIKVVGEVAPRTKIRRKIGTSKNILPDVYGEMWSPGDG